MLSKGPGRHSGAQKERQQACLEVGALRGVFSAPTKKPLPAPGIPDSPVWIEVFLSQCISAPLFTYPDCQLGI